jgi:hypothetical protein
MRPELDEAARPEPGSTGELEHAPSRPRLSEGGFDLFDLGEPRPAVGFAPVVATEAEEPLVVLRCAGPVVRDLLVEKVAVHGERPLRFYSDPC